MQQSKNLSFVIRSASAKQVSLKNITYTYTINASINKLLNGYVKCLETGMQPVKSELLSCILLSEVRKSTYYVVFQIVLNRKLNFRIMLNLCIHGFH